MPHFEHQSLASQSYLSGNSNLDDKHNAMFTKKYALNASFTSKELTLEKFLLSIFTF